MPTPKIAGLNACVSIVSEQASYKFKKIIGRTYFLISFEK